MHKQLSDTFAKYQRLETPEQGVESAISGARGRVSNPENHHSFENPNKLDFLNSFDCEKIVFVGGGTGGHISPIVSIVHHLRESNNPIIQQSNTLKIQPSKNPRIQRPTYIWIGGKDSQESETAKKEGIEFVSIPTLKLSTTKSPKILLYPLVLVRGILAARKILKEQTSQIHSPDSLRSKGQESKNPICVFSKGGPGSVAVGIAAWSLGIPLYIHESDTIPGRSNRILARFATKIFLGFGGAEKYFESTKCIVVGQILHRVFEKKQFSQSDFPVTWKTHKKHILVICGSQGSRTIFQQILRDFTKDDTYEWIVSLGKLNTDMKKDFEKMLHTQAVEWISQENIAHLLMNTDLTLTRASATTLAEIESFDVKKIIIPLPYSGGNHQFYNAKEYEKTGDTILEQLHLMNLRSTIELAVYDTDKKKTSPQ